jgi:hypothetical protein
MMLVCNHNKSTSALKKLFSLLAHEIAIIFWTPAATYLTKKIA